jgi:hypothetical protein
LEKYGVPESFIMELPRIYEDKLAAERLLAAEAIKNNPPVPQQSEDAGVEDSMQPPAPPK